MSQLSKRKIHPAWLMLLIGTVGAIFYMNSLDGEFVWDDLSLIKNNYFLHGDVPITKIFSQSIRAGAGVKGDTFYRPVQILSYMWDYKIAGLDVRMYHATSVIVHILVGVSLFWLFYLVTERRGLSLVGALLYMVHPLHTEAVSYISGRADPLMALFMLWTFGLYIMSRKRTRPVLLILSYMCYVGALLSKEYALILPIFLILYHMSFHEKIPWKNLIGFFALGLLFLVVRSNLVESSHDPAFIPPSFLERIPGIFVAFVQYLKLIFWPMGLHMEYGGKYFDYSYGLMWVGLAVFIGFLTILKQSKKKNPLVFFGLSWFLVGLIPHSNIIPLNAYMAEHWLYVPLMGFVLAFVCVVDQFKIPPLSKSIAGGVLICLLGFLTIRQNQIWRTPVILYEHTLKYSRDSSRIMNNLGVIYYQQGQKEKAIRLFENAIKVEPRNINSYSNLGNAYRNMGQFEKALALYQKVLQITPDDAGIHSNIGNIYLDQGFLEEAERYYKKAVSVNPYHATSFNNLGLVYFKRSDLPISEKMFQKALSLNPYYAEACYTLSLIYYELGRMKDAILYFDRAKSLGYSSPDFAEVLKPHRTRYR